MLWLAELGHTDDPQCMNCGIIETIEPALQQGLVYSYSRFNLLEN